MATSPQARLVPGHGVCLVETSHPDHPGPGEAFVAMRLAPVNPADRLMIAGRYGVALPEEMILGAEGVGEVVAVGPGVEELAAGDRVIPLTRGNWTRMRCLPASELIRVPDTLPLEQAAMLRINPATAWRLLATAPLQAGDTVLQNGGRSAVAGLVEQIATTRGISTLTVSRHAEPGERLLADGPDLVARVREKVGQARIRLALDCVAGGATGRLAACLAEGGRITVFGHLSGEPCHIASTLLTGRGLTLAGFSLRPAEVLDSMPALQALYARLATFLVARPLPVSAICPLSRLDDALGGAHEGKGKLLLDLQA